MDFNIAPGVRITVRGEDFLVTGVDTNSVDDSRLIHAEGISDLVRGHRYLFDSAIDSDISVLDPVSTRLVADRGLGDCLKTRLIIETALRNASHISGQVEIAQKTAISCADYQFEPVLKALKLPRPRLLIADGVGLGKTVETGIIMAELIKRGKGQRILVVALQSILKQFQQEIWSRFAIPLVRLDSIGIEKIKAELPINKNPFEYYDKVIVSIDTLKNNAKFKHYLEKTRWDIVVVDEVHTVASSSSLRGELARFLANRCEALIFTSATPHNGKKENFANIISMLEPTAIPQAGDTGKYGEYCKADIENYYVRRFKKDLENSTVQSQFQDREIIRLAARLEKEEISFLTFQQNMKYKALKNSGGRRNDTDVLFSLTLFKSYMSSPEACWCSLENRVKKVIEQEDRDHALTELHQASELLKKVIDNKAGSKYKLLVDELKKLKWQGRKKDERIIIFAERIETLNMLKRELTTDFKLDEKAVALFYGGLTDIEQQDIIEDFGKEDSSIRLFLTSDAGSQGVNLHYYCHISFNYDIPWSIITLEQRNGRIDRYGQTQKPQIYYLISEAEQSDFKDDLHILKKLIDKEEEVYKSLGDAGSVMKLYNPEEEAARVGEAILNSDEQFLDNQPFDFDSLWADEDETTPAISTTDIFKQSVSLFQDDFDYYKNLCRYLINNGMMSSKELTIQDNGFIELLYNDGIQSYFYDLPVEALPEKNRPFKLTTDKVSVEKAIIRARKKTGEWPEFQMLYDLHPAVAVLMSKLQSALPKDFAIACKTDRIPQSCSHYLFHAQVSNNLGQPVISEFMVVRLDRDGRMADRFLDIEEYIQTYRLNEQLIAHEANEEELRELETHIGDAVMVLNEALFDKQNKVQQEMGNTLEKYQKQLDEWENRSKKQPTLFDTGEAIETVFVQNNLLKNKKEKIISTIETIKSKKSQFYNNMLSLNNDPYLKLLAVFYNI